MKKLLVVAACLLMIPAVSFAAMKPAVTHTKASVVACGGKKVGDAVTMTMKGKPVEATCQEVKGVLKAVVNVKK